MCNNFYTTAREQLDRLDLCTTTVTSRDPEFVTVSIKARLRRKNKLMRAGCLEEATALTERVRKKIKQRKQITS